MASKKLDFKSGRTLICGILNITPDSFSDGGRYLPPEAAAARALELQEQGADLIDIGAESSRPGSEGVSAQEELARLLGPLRAVVKKLRVPVSIDTCKPEVAAACLAEGADFINDISGFTDEGMLRAAADAGAGAIVMHMLGRPRDMQKAPVYQNGAVQDIRAFLAGRAGALRAAGVKDIILDPGIGFGKTLQDNLDIMAGLPRFKELGLPVLVGVSRKSFIGALSPSAPAERLPGTLAACAVCALNGADIVRVHDVREAAQAMAVVDAVKNRAAA
ncbi:MAG: dihydropteroate synthase [Elusimicrobia bacterium GWF2_62_30]|nr:MAG: dihydropteroate synthase [Elusimicrobia bacterium GWF2_62_30]